MILRTLSGLTRFTLVAVLIGLLFAIPGLLPALGVAKATDSSMRYWNSLPSELTPRPAPQRSVMLDAKGDVIAQFYTENRVNATFEEIPETMKDAIVSIEDNRFYERGPIDIRGTVRAATKTASGEGVQGGSTLTQQYVKNVLLYNADSDAERAAATEQTAERKIQEIKYAVGMEERMSKDEILTGYLNIANFGDGAYGVKAAAKHYFSVDVEDLDLSQAALLAGIVQNPAGFNPVKNPKDAKERRDTVLMRMEQVGAITYTQKVDAQRKPLGLKVSKEPNGCIASKYPFFCQDVMNVLMNDPAFGKTKEERAEFIRRGGLRITTTLDPRIQKIATDTAMEGLGKNNSFATSIAVVEPGTGQVKAIGTNRDFGDGAGKTQVDYSTSSFQIGSTFKPFTLLAALEGGWDINTKMDAPARWCAPAPNKGCFTNLGPSENGVMDAPNALAVSSNTFFTKMSVQTDTGKVQQVARTLGIPVPDTATEKDTSTTLGVHNVSPVQLANAYATIAASGRYCRPTWITKVTTVEGKKIDAPDPQCSQVVEPENADVLANAMRDVIDGKNKARTGADLSLGRPAMGKTGTTDDSAAVWFAGGTPQYQAAVWVGDPRGGFAHPVKNVTVYGKTITEGFGGTAAGPLWKNAMLDIHEGLEEKDFASPAAARKGRQAIMVPDLRGMSLAAANQAAEDLGMTLEVSADLAQMNTAVPADVVVLQSLSPGSERQPGAKIMVTMSAGSTLPSS